MSLGFKVIIVAPFRAKRDVICVDKELYQFFFVFYCGTIHFVSPNYKYSDGMNLLMGWVYPNLSQGRKQCKNTYQGEGV